VFGKWKLKNKFISDPKNEDPTTTTESRLLQLALYSCLQLLCLSRDQRVTFGASVISRLDTAYTHLHTTVCVTVRLPWTWKQTGLKELDIKTCNHHTKTWEKGKAWGSIAGTMSFRPIRRLYCVYHWVRAHAMFNVILFFLICWLLSCFKLKLYPPIYYTDCTQIQQTNFRPICCRWKHL